MPDDTRGPTRTPSHPCAGPAMARDDSAVVAGEAAPAPLCFDDLTVGRRFVSAARALDAAAIKAFARDYDPQPFHTDETAAQGTFFGGLAASGWHTAALTMRLIVDSVPFAGGVIGAGVELKWPRPTRPGDVLTVTSEVVEMRVSQSRPERGIVKMRSVTMNQRGEVVQDLTSTMMVPRRR
jgi:acyl dehydratase